MQLIFLYALDILLELSSDLNVVFDNIFITFVQQTNRFFIYKQFFYFLNITLIIQPMLRLDFKKSIMIVFQLWTHYNNANFVC